MTDQGEKQNTKLQGWNDDWKIPLSTTPNDMGGYQLKEKVTITVNPITGEITQTVEKFQQKENKINAQIASYLGILLILIAIFLAFYFSEQTPLQTHITRGVFALGGGAFFSEVPGFLKVNISIGKRISIAAVGAIGIFVILFMVVPTT